MFRRAINAGLECLKLPILLASLIAYVCIFGLYFN
jgi:hypothetical protein